jgi:hypothetical protein
VLVALSALAGLVLPPLGAYTRAVLGLALRERDVVRRRAFALDSAGEEGALIVAPLIVALVVAVASPSAALIVAAAGFLAGTLAAGRSRLVAAAAGRAERPRAQARAPAALWLLVAALVPPAAALGAVDVAVPTAARAQGAPGAAGVLLAAMAVGTVAGSLLAGTRGPPGPRFVGCQLGLGAGLAAAALASERLTALGPVLVFPGVADGALFASLYVLVDRLAPAGSGTRIFAWLVTANNGGIAAGAAVAGALSQSAGAAAGLWFGAVCAALGALPAAVGVVMSARVPKGDQTGGSPRVPSDKRGISARQGNGDPRGGT